MKGKIRNITIKTILAALAVLAGGVLLSFVSSDPASIKTMPFFDDVTDENRALIENVYMNRLMSAESDNHFGIDSPLSVSELAYLGIGMYEDKNGIRRSYETYSENGDEYIAKAKEYGIWQGIEKTGEDAVTGADVAVVLAPLAEDVEQIEYYSGYIGMENNTNAQSAIDLYNRGITLDKKISTAYSVQDNITKGETAKLVMMISEPSLRVTQLMPDYFQMKHILETAMSGYQGDWSLYFEDCAMGEVISINSHQVYSASLIKLFVAQTVYTRIAEGALTSSEKLENQLYKMITISDNDAWKALARVLGNGSYMTGMSSVTEVAKASGFSDTGQFMQGSRKNFNFTSVNDCGAYLHKILNGEIISPEYSEKILNLLKQQQIRIKIPSGVPEGVAVANKTGELEYMQGDAAIVYAPSGTYILVIIGDSLENAGLAQAQIRELSSMVYSFLNN